MGIESTIVDLTGARPRLLRQGSISRSDLERVLGVAVEAADSGAPRVSGTLERHYAPDTPLEVVATEALSAWLQQTDAATLAVLAPPAVLDAWPGEPLRYSHCRRRRARTITPGHSMRTCGGSTRRGPIES